jgi:hypothetical protein
MKLPAGRIVSAGQVRVSRDRAPVASIEPCGSEPRIETRTLEGIVQQIIVTCGCGQQTVLQCDYGR